MCGAARGEAWPSPCRADTLGSGGEDPDGGYQATKAEAEAWVQVAWSQPVALERIKLRLGGQREPDSARAGDVLVLLSRAPFSSETCTDAAPARCNPLSEALARADYVTLLSAAEVDGDGSHAITLPSDFPAVRYLRVQTRATAALRIRALDVVHRAPSAAATPPAGGGLDPAAAMRQLAKAMGAGRSPSAGAAGGGGGGGAQGERGGAAEPEKRPAARGDSLGTEEGRSDSSEEQGKMVDVEVVMVDPAGGAHPVPLRGGGGDEVDDDDDDDSALQEAPVTHVRLPESLMQRMFAFAEEHGESRGDGNGEAEEEEEGEGGGTGNGKGSASVRYISPQELLRIMNGGLLPEGDSKEEEGESKEEEAEEDG